MDPEDILEEIEYLIKERGHVEEILDLVEEYAEVYAEQILGVEKC